MEIDQIMTIISNYAFPIAMCLLIYFQNNTTLKKIVELISAVNVRLSYIEKVLGIYKENNEKDWIE